MLSYSTFPTPSTCSLYSQSIENRVATEADLVQTRLLKGVCVTVKRAFSFHEHPHMFALCLRVGKLRHCSSNVPRSSCRDMQNKVRIFAPLLHSVALSKEKTTMAGNMGDVITIDNFDEKMSKYDANHKPLFGLVDMGR